MRRALLAIPLLPVVEAVLTFEDDLQLVPKDVEDAVARVGLRDHVAPQPAPACVLVEVVTRLHGWVHVLEDPGSCSSPEGAEGEGGPGVDGPMGGQIFSHGQVPSGALVTLGPQGDWKQGPQL